MGRRKELRVLGTLGEGVTREWLAGGLPERSGTCVQGRACVWAGFLGLLTRRRWHLGSRSLSQGCAQHLLSLLWGQGLPTGSRGLSELPPSCSVLPPPRVTFMCATQIGQP